MKILHWSAKLEHAKNISVPLQAPRAARHQNGLPRLTPPGLLIGFAGARISMKRTSCRQLKRGDIRLGFPIPGVYYSDIRLTTVKMLPISPLLSGERHSTSSGIGRKARPCSANQTAPGCRGAFVLPELKGLALEKVCICHIICFLPPPRSLLPPKQHPQKRDPSPPPATRGSASVGNLKLERVQTEAGLRLSLRGWKEDQRQPRERGRGEFREQS